MCAIQNHSADGLKWQNKRQRPLSSVSVLDHHIIINYSIIQM